MTTPHYIGIKQLSFDDYKAAPGVNKSRLDHIAPPKTPAHCKAYMDAPEDEPTDAQRIGQATHSLLLHADHVELFSHIFAVKPPGYDGRTKAGAEWRQANAGKIAITHDEATAIRQMVTNVWTHPKARIALEKAGVEQSIFAEDRETGLLRKCRIDINPSRNFIADLKTTEDASQAAFSKDIAKWRYHVQAAYYLDICNTLAMDKLTFVFIVVEKSPPYAVAVYELSDVAVDDGREAYKRDLRLYAECQQSGKWPGYATEVYTIDLPDWAQRRAA